MLARLSKIVLDVLSRLPPSNYLVPALAATPAIVYRPDIFQNNHHKQTILDSLFGQDAILWATPKSRTPIRKILSRRYGDDNWKYGTKLFKPKRNIVTCLECGDFHEVHTICRSCFATVQKESEKILDNIRTIWHKNQPVDQDVQVVYQGEQPDTSLDKRVVEIDRPRPLWFAPNLSQKSANIGRQVSGPVKEHFDDRVKSIKSCDDT